jgi:hypothetical protein
MSEKWSSIWPTEPGVYWFYGVRTKSREFEPGLYFVRVWKIANGWAYVADGNFLFEGEGAKGFFSPVELPILPKFGDVHG